MMVSEKKLEFNGINCLSPEAECSMINDTCLKTEIDIVSGEWCIYGYRQSGKGELHIGLGLSL